LADSLLGRSSPFALGDVYETIAEQLRGEGFTVHRNPLVHQPTEGRRFTVDELRDLAQQPGNEDLGAAVDELRAAGASTAVTARSWHHITWNNCPRREQQYRGQTRIHADVRRRSRPS
jgi:hypothetical protein